MNLNANRMPEDVFTPKAIASREMFARRNEPALNGNPGLQDSLRDALREQGGQVLMYGDTGVGKSSLLRYAAEDEGMTAVVVECFSSKSYEDLIEDGIRKLLDVRELHRTSTKTIGAEVEAGVKVKFLLSLKGALKGEYGREREFEVVAKPPLDVLLEAMAAAGVRLIVFDNFQNVHDGRDRELVAQTMEFMSDRSDTTGDIKAIVIGIAEDAAALIGGSGSFQRRTTEIGVPRMPDDEIREILTRGFGLLELNIAPDPLARMVFYSDGFPFFAHLIGLQSSRAARGRKIDTISDSILDASLERVANGVDRSFADRTRKAFEAGGDVQPRRRIMSILASSGQREWRSADVISSYEDAYEARTEYSFLLSALAALMDDKYGAVLHRTGTRGKYIYRFADPHMRPYLRITKAADRSA